MKENWLLHGCGTTKTIKVTARGEYTQMIAECQQNGGREGQGDSIVATRWRGCLRESTTEEGEVDGCLFPSQIWAVLLSVHMGWPRCRSELDTVLCGKVCVCVESNVCESLDLTAGGRERQRVTEQFWADVSVRLTVFETGNGPQYFGELGYNLMFPILDCIRCPHQLNFCSFFLALKRFVTFTSSRSSNPGFHGRGVNLRECHG